MTSWSTPCGGESAGLEPQRAVAGADPDARPAGLGQDHHHREDRQAPATGKRQARADGVAGRAPPGRQQQLAILGEQTGVETLPIVPGEPPVAIAKRAMQMAQLEGFDVVMLDTAGRLASTTS